MEFDELSGLLAGILNDEAPAAETEQEPEAEVEAVAQTAVPKPPEKPDSIEGNMDDIDFNDLLASMSEPVITPDVPEPPSFETAEADDEQPDEIELEEQANAPEPTALDEEQSLDDLLASVGDDEPAADAQPAVIFKETKAAPTEHVPMPQFTTEELAESLDLRNFASLVTLNTRRWSGKVKDRQASKLAADAASADEQAFETHKRLLAGADEKLRAVTKAIDDARTRHYAMTLPWSTTGRTDTGKRTGGRLLPHTMFKEYITEMGKHKAAMDAAAAEFEAGYTDAINKARSHLGDRFDPTEYPNPAVIRQHFGLDFDFHPIPVGADFQGLADQQVAKLSHALERKNRVMVENAMQETWARAFDLVARAAEKFSEPEALFHYTLIDSLRDAGTSLKYLNVTSDPMIEKVRLTIEKHLTMYDATDIRKDEALRARLGKIATALLKEMRSHASQ